MNIAIMIILAPFSGFERLYLTSFLNVMMIFLNDFVRVDSFFHILPVLNKSAVPIISHDIENREDTGSNVEKRFVIIFILWFSFPSLVFWILLFDCFFLVLILLVLLLELCRQ